MSSAPYPINIGELAQYWPITSENKWANSVFLKWARHFLHIGGAVGQIMFSELALMRANMVPLFTLIK